MPGGERDATVHGIAGCRMSATKNIGASVRARLLNRARADKVEFNLMLTRYALERLLYRLSVSEWSNEFL
jgi:hypothetical protein